MRYITFQVLLCAVVAVWLTHQRRYPTSSRVSTKMGDRSRISGRHYWHSDSCPAGWKWNVL